jgi:uncharacterized protein YjbI with pentapeptide repeats
VLTNARMAADFTGANFSGATLTNVSWLGGTCPDGTDINANGDTCIGHLVP